MKEVTVVIPTRNRIEKLNRTIDSIPKLEYINIVVVCDGDNDTYNYLIQSRKEISAVLVNQHRGAVYCRNLAIKNVKDGVLYATDDITFEKHSIQYAFDCFNNNFPDDDGVVGFVQDLRFHPTGVALVGKTFVDRYPNGQLFYPKYWHFACQEISWHCRALGKKYVQECKAKVIHYHPMGNRGMIDQTHKDARIMKSQDMKIAKYRRNHGKVWPIS